MALVGVNIIQEKTYDNSNNNNSFLFAMCIFPSISALK